MIRCKFRVLSVTKGWASSTVVDLRPCQAKDKSYEDGRYVVRENPENAAYWSATPTGEARLTYPEGKPVPEWATPGQYVYLNAGPEVDDAPHSLAVTLRSWGGVCVDLSSHLSQVKFDVSPQDGRPAILQILADAIPRHHASLVNAGDIEARWGVRWTPTEEPVAVPA